MLFKSPIRNLLSEGATGTDLVTPPDEELKDDINDLEKTLNDDTAVEDIKDEDKSSTTGIPMVAEAVAIMESSSTYGKAKFLIKLEDVIAVRETEGEEKAKAETPYCEPSEEDCEAHEPDSADIIKDIADKNGVEPEQIAVVIRTENVKFYAQAAILESKCNKTGNAAKSKKKLKAIKKTVDELSKGNIKMVKA